MHVLRFYLTSLREGKNESLEFIRHRRRSDPNPIIIITITIIIITTTYTTTTTTTIMNLGGITTYDK